ncbi:MAG: hypothetical protein E6R03_18515 [Hyphomicrobiaceae bacterium]|nr:MAG: hypothetical protein E6R03_18515 [Hyphomicrobiaceae bacterium]
MAVYKFKFGEVTVAEGLAPVSPELHQYIEELAEQRFRECMEGVVAVLLDHLAVGDVRSCVAEALQDARAPLQPIPDEQLAKMPGPVTFVDDEAVA